MADVKITELPEDTSPDSADVTITVDDPGGTPVTKKATWANIISSGLPAATETSLGGVEKATDAETIAGTATGTEGPLFSDPSQLAAAIQNNSWIYGEPSGGTDAYVINPTPAITAYASGQCFIVKADVANTGPATLNVSGLGAKDIKKNHDVDLATGDIEAGAILVLSYDGTNFQLLSALSSEAILKSILTTKGDMIVRTASGVVRLPVGADNTVLTADSLQTEGIAYKAPAVGLLTQFTTDVTTSGAEADLINYIIPANTIGTGGVVKGRLYVSALGIGNGSNDVFNLRLGSTVVCSLLKTGAGTSSGYTGFIDFAIYGTGATNSQEASLLVDAANASGGINYGGIQGYDDGTSAEDSTTALTLRVTFSSTGGGAITVANGYVQSFI